MVNRVSPRGNAVLLRSHVNEAQAVIVTHLDHRLEQPTTQPPEGSAWVFNQEVLCSCKGKIMVEPSKGFYLKRCCATTV